MTRRPFASGSASGATPAAAGRTRTPRPVLSDVINAVMVAGLGVVLIAVGGTGSSGMPQAFEPSTHWWHLAPLALACAAISVQSRRPVPAFAVATIAVLIDAAMGLQLALVIAWSNPIYAVGRFARASVRRGISIGAVVATLLAAPAIVVLGGDVSAAMTTTLQIGAVVAIALWWSAEVRAGDEAAAAERRRAADAARLAELASAETVRAERGAMARDLHDLISSRLSAIALQTTATLQLEPDAARERRIVGEVRRESVAALDDMRDLIRLLRSPGDEPDGLVVGGLETLDDVISRFRAAGLDLVEADAPAALEGIDREAERTLVLVAREALTNAFKHGSGRAALRLTAETDRARFVIENPIGGGAAERQPGGDHPRPGLGAGIGLDAMRERLEAVGGSLEISTVDGASSGRATWRLAASVPLSGAASRGEAA
ncbi:sensor histidine kinase [Pseudoclavibacter endophyticus]|nr:histidine kinase [Pseudoclavibacter endophyticus]